MENKNRSFLDSVKDSHPQWTNVKSTLGRADVLHLLQLLPLSYTIWLNKGTSR